MQMNNKLRELFLYGIFGVLTTLINIVAFYLLAEPLGVNYMAANILAWLIAFVFAFVTNKHYVFGSKDWSRAVWVPEGVQFLTARAFTGLMDCVLMYVFISLLEQDKMLTKIVVNGLVIIANYILSKLWVFKNKHP